MTHPSHIENSIAGIVETEMIKSRLDSIEKEIEGKLKKLKQRVIQLCDIKSVYIDSEVEWVDVFYRIASVPKSMQEEGFETRVVIECVKQDGEEITLEGWQMQIAYETIMNSSEVNLRA